MFPVPSGEVYMANGPGFDMRLIQRGARLRRSPYFDATQKHGCTSYTVYNHTFLPNFYDDPETEYWHLIEHVALWDVGVERQLEVSGPDGLEFAQLLTPRDLSKCAVGQGKYALIVAPDGGIINDPVALRLDEDTFWFSLADSDALLYALGVAVGAGLDVRIREPDVWPLQVQGPKSRALMQDVFGNVVTSLKYYHHAQTDLDGIPVLVTRTGWTGELGYEIYLRDRSRGVELWDRLMEAGKPYDLRATGPSDIRRIEAGILNYGADMTLADTPYHVGLDWTVDLDSDANFLAKEALRAIQAKGVERRLVGIEIAGARIEFNETKWPVRRDGERVGHVPSAIYSPRLRKNIGYAMVPIAFSDLGTELSVTTPWGERAATVVPRVFVDPKKEVPKS